MECKWPIGVEAKFNGVAKKVARQKGRDERQCSAGHLPSTARESGGNQRHRCRDHERNQQRLKSDLQNHFEGRKGWHGYFLTFFASTRMRSATCSSTFPLP
jgi:hypothetical protein